MERIIKALDSGRSPLHWATFATFLAVALIVRASTFQGYQDWDSREYSVLANELAQGRLHIPDYDGPGVFALRLGVYGPTALVIRLFGLSERTLVAYPFLISILGCLLAYVFARYLITPLAGLIALGLLAIVRLDVELATSLLPDALAAFWANVGVLLACIALDRPKLRQSLVLAALSGFFFGISWLCKEAVAFLVPFVALFTLVVARTISWSTRLKCLAAIGIGALVVLLAETIFFAKLTGDPLFRMHTTEHTYVQCAVWFFDQASPIYGWQEGGYARALCSRLFYSGPKSIFYNQKTSYLPAFALFGVAWALIFRRRSFVVPSIWLVTLVFMYNFMTSSFTAYQPLPLFGRYLEPMLLPSLLLVGGFLATSLAGDAHFRAGMVSRLLAVVLIAGCCRVCASQDHVLMKTRPEQVERELAVRFKEGEVVYTDRVSAANLVFFRTGSLERSNAQDIPWENVDLSHLPRGAYVFVNKDGLELLTSFYKYTTPSEAAAPPDNWEKIWSAENHGDLYVVGGQ